MLAKLRKPNLSPRYNRSCAMELCVFCGLIAAFLIQFFVNGVSISVDSERFVLFSTITSPLYPWVLAAFRAVFGEANYFFYVVLFQNVFLAVASYSLVTFLKKVFRLNNGMYILLSIAVFSTFMVQKFFTSNKMVTSNAILSEGIAIPLYFLYMIFMLRSAVYREKKAYIRAVFCTFLLVITRGQLYWTVLATALVGFRVFVPDEKQRGLRRLGVRLMPVFLAAVVGMSAMMAECTNTLIHGGIFRTSTAGRDAILATAFFCSDPQDAELFDEGSVERVIFDDIQGYIDEERAALRYHEGDIFSWYRFFSSVYDPLKTKIVFSINEHAEKPVGIWSPLTRGLVAANWMGILGQAARNFYVGLMRSVAVFHRYINGFVLLFYAYCIGYIYLFRKRQELAAVRVMLGTALLCTLLNALFVSFGVFALSRYMFYNLPVLYMLALVSLNKGYLSVRKGKCF